jgi:RHS repeat-associated protein
MTATYQYDAFGAVKTKTGSGDTAYRFTGEMNDSQVARELYYLRARYYDPALGRFLSRDSLMGSDTVPQTRNRYTYAYNNPANLVDPYGLCGIKGAGDVADCAAKIAEGFAYSINKLGKAIDLCAELGPSKCPAGLADKLEEALWETVKDAAEWLGEDYHWLTLVEVGAAAAFGAGLPMVLAENATLSELLVGTALISGGLGVGVSAYTFDVAGLKARAVKQGNMWALAEGAVTLGTAPFSFMGGETGWLIGTGGMAFDYLDEFWGDSGARSGPKE